MSKSWTRPETLEARFWPKVDRRGDDECWPWMAAVVPDGYGQIDVGFSTRGAHRVAYELLIGPIPEGLTLDHLCRNRRCVNPAHLEPVTERENILRGESPSAKAARKTHCPQGHAYAGLNLRLTVKGHRVCRACCRQRDRARRAVRKQAA